MSIIDLLLASMYFILPAYLANMLPVLAAKLKFPFGLPINKKHLGDHKTWRGFVFGYIAALIVVLIQTEIFKKGMMRELSIVDYSSINSFLLAAAFGLGALGGDAIKSFFKRRLGKKPGAAWFPFDQLDFVIGAILAVSLLVPIDWKVIAMILIVTPILHLLTNILAYHIGFKKVWW